MWQPKDVILVAVSLCVLVCTAAGDGGGRPLVTAITRDAATSLYTIPVKSGRPMVLDISGPIVWSTCDDGASHSTLECNDIDCMRAHRFHPPNCQHTGELQQVVGRRYIVCLSELLADDGGGDRESGALIKTKREKKKEGRSNGPEFFYPTARSCPAQLFGQSTSGYHWPLFMHAVVD